MSSPRQADTMEDGSWVFAMGYRLAQQQEETTPRPYDECIRERARTVVLLREFPYCLPLYIRAAQIYGWLGFPDLAAGEAYKALLLADAVGDEGDEFHEVAVEALGEVIDRLPAGEGEMLEEGGRGLLEDDAAGEERGEGEGGEPLVWVGRRYLPLIYDLLVRSLVACNCLRSASEYLEQGSVALERQGNRTILLEQIRGAVARHFDVEVEELAQSEYDSPSTWPDSGFVRREQYPWNDFEPDRVDDLPTLNAMMEEVAPRLEVKAVDLPNLTEGDDELVTQLGVFAKEDIPPGEIVLDETSMLTANNKLQDALCDACSADLPELNSPEASSIQACPECEVVFCSAACHDKAMQLYHPALCGTDADTIAKDVPPAQAADALYALLLLRALALAETQSEHPLNLPEVKYIWADFQPTPPSATATTSPDLPRTLPFSFEHNIRLPYHMLEKLDLDPFTHADHYTPWVFNTLYAKFRGTASARLSGLGGRAIRGPEVSAVHPLWCLANHSCDPNVGWEWGGSVKFWVREARVPWKRGGEAVEGKRTAGLRRGEEVLNHYCDVELGVVERREWARGALGGDCRCERCVWEAGEV